MIVREDIEEPTTLLRIFSEEQQYGDPYVAVVTLRWISEDTVEALGMHGKMTPSLTKELLQWLHDNKVALVKSIRHSKPTYFDVEKLLRKIQ